MNIALWILAGVLGTAFAVAGTSLLLLPRERYRAIGASQAWTDDFDSGHLKTIGAVKLTGGLGLVLPAVTGIATILTPLAACGLALFMAGAGTTRFRRSEWTFLVVDLLFLTAFVYIAYGRIELHPFT